MAVVGFFFAIMLLILGLVALIFIGMAMLLLTPFRRRERRERAQREADKSLLEAIQCEYCGIYVAETPKVVNGLCQACGRVVRE